MPDLKKETLKKHLFIILASREFDIENNMQVDVFNLVIPSKRYWILQRENINPRYNSLFCYWKENNIEFWLDYMKTNKEE